MRGLGLATTIGAGIAAAALVSLTQKAERVSTAFREVDTLVQGSSNAQEKYGQLVSDLNTQFGLQADKMEVIEGLYQSISAGVDQSTEAQREFLETAAELAVVGRVELGTSVDILSTVMNTYGYEASQAQEISESLFQTVIFGKTRMEELAPVLGRVAALGSNLGVQIDEIGASMGVLTRTGFGARVAATGLRNIFRAMLKPSGQMQETLFQIASEQDFFADQFEGSSERIRGIASDFREASDAVEEFTEKQADARATQENASTAIQEARLKITALEEERLEQLPELTNEQVNEAESVEQLESIISDYQFTVNKARLEEEKFRKEKEEAQATMEDERSSIADMIASTGDLQGGIGQLILENQDFVDTMVQIKERINETDTSMSDMFPRTRALQGALALVGEEGQMLTDIYKDMEEGTFDAVDAWDDMDEAARSNFDSFEDFKEATQDVTAGDLDEWFEKATGPQQKLRNSISQLNEAMSSLGQTFTEDVVDSFVNFADTITGLVDRFNNIDEAVRKNISQFAVLATAVGLLLGPLLFFTGQLMVMASVMGTGGLLTFVGPLAIAFGVLATSLQSAIAGGEGAESTFGNLRNAFSGVIDFILLMKSAFMGEVLPALQYLGSVFIGIFTEIQSQLSDSEGIGSFQDIVYQLARALREGITVVGSFLDNNKELIAGLITLAVDTLLNEVIPAIMRIAQAGKSEFLPLLKELAGIVSSDVVPAVKSLAPHFNDVVSAIVNDSIPALGDLLKAFIAIMSNVNWSGIASSLTLFIGFLIAMIPVATKIVSLLAGFVQWIAPLIGGIISLVAIFGPWIALIVKVSAVLITVYSVVSTVVSVLTGLYTWFVLIASVIGVSVGWIFAIIAAIGLLIGAVVLLRSQIVAAFRGFVDYVVKQLNVLWDALTGEISWMEAGKRILENMAKGVMDSIPIIESAMDEVMRTITAFLPASPADTGPFSDVAPEDYGKNIGEYTAEGMLSTEGDISAASKSLTESSVPDTDAAEYSAGKNGQGFNFGSGKEGKGMPGSGGMGKEVTIEKGAIKVGPFHGISDEELPEEVREQVQRSLQDLMDEIKGSGKDSTASLASGDGI